MFRSRLHDPWPASVLGVALAVTFGVCFLTGLVDWAVQRGPTWFGWPSRPVNLYRITEGVHVVTGIASIPLLMAKLWVVYPKLFVWPPLQGIAGTLERLSLVPLVGGSLFLLFTGVLNIAYWYGPLPFFFPTAHFWVAWITVGALVVHVGAKATETRIALQRGTQEGSNKSTPPSPGDVDEAIPHGGLTRRGFMATAAATAGALVAVVVGEAAVPLSRLAVLAPRNPLTGPQRLPVNQSAIEAQVVELARDSAYRLSVEGRCRRRMSFNLEQLRRLPQRQAGLPITCVEGWSASASWRGVSVPLLLQIAGARPGAPVRIESLEAADRLYSSSVLHPDHSSDPDTLLALELNGEELDLDHGYPVRLIAPNRAGVLQTKWVSKVVVL